MLTFGDAARRVFSFIGMTLVFGVVLFTVLPLTAGYFAARDFPEGTPSSFVAGLWAQTTLVLDYGPFLAGVVVALSAVGSFGRQLRTLGAAAVLALGAGYGTHCILTHPKVVQNSRLVLEMHALFKKVDPAAVKAVAENQYPAMADTSSDFRRKYDVVVKRVEAGFLPGMRQPLLALWAGRETERALAREKPEGK